MVEKIIDLSVKNRFIVIFITILLTFASIYAIKNTSLDLLSVYLHKFLKLRGFYFQFV